MQLFEPFYWMFRVNDFKNHFFFLCLIVIMLLVLLVSSALCFFSTELFSILSRISLVFFIISMLIISGYYWTLTDNVINRNTDIIAESIYNGNIKVQNNVKLPELNPLSLIWRGFSSVVATIIFLVPIISIFLLINKNIVQISEFWNFTSLQTNLLLLLIAIFPILLLPGLLWNYASKNSILSSLNIFKAIYIFEYYPIKYVLNTVLYVVYIIIQIFLVKSILLALGINFLIYYENNHFMISLSSIAGFTWGVIFLILISALFSIYSIFVGAYLLGTITPKSEY